MLTRIIRIKKAVAFAAIVLMVTINEGFGQSNYTVEKLQKLDVQGHSAQLSPDGKKLLYTTANFKGLRLYDMEKNVDWEISDKEGAGYMPVITAEYVYYKTSDNEDLISRKTLSGESTEVLTAKKNQQPATYLAREINSEAITATLSEDLRHIIIETNGSKREIAPLGKNDYLNVSLSPDKSKLLFRVSGIGSFVTDLQGEVIQKYDDAEFPTWISDEEILFAEVEDDGYEYTTSELYIGVLGEQKKHHLTGKTDALGLYPGVTNNAVVFNTPKGDIYLLEFSRD